MSFRRPWVWLVIVAILLLTCAFSLDAYHHRQCEERGGTWGSLNDGSGGIGCKDAKGNIIDLNPMF